MKCFISFIYCYFCIKYVSKLYLSLDTSYYLSTNTYYDYVLILKTDNSNIVYFKSIKFKVISFAWALGWWNTPLYLWLSLLWLLVLVRLFLRE